MNNTVQDRGSGSGSGSSSSSSSRNATAATPLIVLATPSY